MPVTAMPVVAPGDTITSAGWNVITSNISLLDGRTGGDPGVAGKYQESTGTLGGGWVAPSVDDTQVPTADAGALSLLVSNLANRVKAITGKASWRTAPSSSIDTLIAADTTNANAAAAAQTTANAAMPVSGGTFTGNIAMAATKNINVPSGSVTAASGDFTTLTSGSQTVWNRGNDGSGSGLDADMVDGIHAASFLDVVSVAQTIGVVKTITLNTGATMVLGNSGGNRDVNVFGSFQATGLKSAAVPGPDGMLHSFAATEATRMYFEDYGSARIEHGRVRVEIPEDYRHFVDTEADYYVWLTPHGDGHVWIEDVGPDAFVIRASQDIRVDWRITALRKDLNQVRLEVCGDAELLPPPGPPETTDH